MKDQTKIPVRLKLTCSYPLDGGEKSAHFADGELAVRDDGECILRYIESDNDCADVSISFTEGGETVTIAREGNTSSLMRFEADRTHPCIYRVGEHELEISVCTSRLENRLFTSGNGSLKLEYDIISGSEAVSKVLLELFIHAKKGESANGSR